jgi:hypothetical protein
MFSPREKYKRSLINREPSPLKLLSKDGGKGVGKSLRKWRSRQKRGIARGRKTPKDLDDPIPALKTTIGAIAIVRRFECRKSAAMRVHHNPIASLTQRRRQNRV